MIENNEKMKIDINGSVSDSTKEIASDIGGMFLMAITVGCLFAPAFGGIIENEILRPNGKDYPLDYDFTKLYAKIAKIKIGLWIVCFIAWGIVACCIATSSL